MQTEVLPAYQPNAINHAADILRNGGVVVFPTDTVYGLGALAFDAGGISRLYTIKGRSQAKAIAVLLAHQDQLGQICKNPSEMARSLADRFWPGPLTLVVPRHPDLPDALAPLPTIGVRVPNHPVAQELLQLTGPLGVTSANLSGEGNPTSVEQVLEQLEGRVHLVLDDGNSPGGIPSTVVDCTLPEYEVLRPGPITQGQLDALLA